MTQFICDTFSLRVEKLSLQGMTKRDGRGETGTKLQAELRAELRVCVRVRVRFNSKQKKKKKLN